MPPSEKRLQRVKQTEASCLRNHPSCKWSLSLDNRVILVTVYNQPRHFTIENLGYLIFPVQKCMSQYKIT